MGAGYLPGVEPEVVGTGQFGGKIIVGGGVFAVEHFPTLVGVEPADPVAVEVRFFLAGLLLFRAQKVLPGKHGLQLPQILGAVGRLRLFQGVGEESKLVSGGGQADFRGGSGVFRLMIPLEIPLSVLLHVQFGVQI